MNRLADEKSPYLLQHADNPVDWHPWGEAAFSRAKKENKPIFLSIGYSTCHWCHVMAHESFADPEVAARMNDAFVCIKVDREERPDIDSIYMTVCTMLTGSGGWPLTIIMTPGKKPFFAGTYFPKNTLPGHIGMLELPGRIKEIWDNRQPEVLNSAASIVDALRQAGAGQTGTALQMETIHKAYNQLADRFDPEHGGFSIAPKFPSPHNLIFLLRYWKQTGDPQALQMVEKTLAHLRLGGMFDHIGFGFHRYSTDQQWFLPHFEKMLYDQAMLAMAYTEAYQATGNDLYKTTVEEIFSYVERELTDRHGAFYSAEDADSEGQEGKYYVWTDAELRRLLNAADAELAIGIFNTTPNGNFADEASGRKTGANILHLKGELPALAAELEMPAPELEQRLENIRQIILNGREGRVHPHKDDKILTDWNGLMIAALAKGARIFDNSEFLKNAHRSADFILQKMRTNTGRLLHRYRAGEAAIPAMLDDYAFLAWGLLELYEASFVNAYLQEALTLTDIALTYFWDNEADGFFQTAHDGEELPARQKDFQDGAIPSGNSVALSNLLRLARMTGRIELEEKGRRLTEAFAAAVAQTPSAYTHFLQAAAGLFNPASEIVIVGDPEAANTKKMIKTLWTLYEPNSVMLFKNSHDPEEGLSGIAPFTKDHAPLRGQATAYVCTDFRCELPTTDVNEAVRRIQNHGGRRVTT
jgi:uncharacterized protein YyaL (SSP411 family)